MARERRSIAGSSFESDKLDLCTDSEMLLFFGLIVKADDEGRETASPANLKKRYSNRDWTRKKLQKMMEHLHSVRLIDWYQCENCGNSVVYQVIDFEYYQRGAWQGKTKVPSKYQSLEEGHCKQCGGQLLPVGGDTESSHKIIEVNRSEGKGDAREAAPPEAYELSHKAQEIKGWNFTEGQDADFFTRLLVDFSQEMIAKVIEDLRTYQEKPAKKYTNLHATLRNWCKLERERHPDNGSQAESGPVDDLGRAMIPLNGQYYTQKEVDMMIRDGQAARAEKGYQLL